jgi:hypothetical protein
MKVAFNIDDLMGQFKYQIVIHVQETENKLEMAAAFLKYRSINIRKHLFIFR